jgi:hypothetical protein
MAGSPSLFLADEMMKSRKEMEEEEGTNYLTKNWPLGEVSEVLA